MFDLSGQTAVVIGGTSGIGLAIVRGLAEAGANVVPTGRRGALVESIAGEIRQKGRRSMVTTCDVTDRASIDNLLKAVLDEFKSVEILVNCAGRTAKRPTVEVEESEWNAIFDTNLTGTLRACQAFGAHMTERGYGRIVNICSLSSFVGLYQVAAYGASKSAVRALTQNLAIEFAPRGVCVNAIVPGVFRTEMNTQLLDGTARGQEFLMRTPMKRFGKIEELAGAAVYLSSREASFTTGHLLVVDGGFLASGVNQ